MTRSSSQKRSQLVAAANAVAHAKGFSNMTLADVAASSKVPLGNVYYYFRTKEALGEAVVDSLLDAYRAERGRWEQEPDPKRRLGAWLDMVESQRAILATSGCPIGSLCTDFGKTSASLRVRAETIFSELIDFAEAQFAALGMGSSSRAYAIHLLAALQGAAVLALTFNDESVVEREIGTLREWLSRMEPEQESVPTKENAR